MTAWVVVLVAGAGSFLFRISVVALLGRFEPPPWLERVAGYVVPAAFAALAAAALAAPIGRGARVALPPLIAAAVTALVARTKSASVAFAVGLSVLWISAAVIGAA